MKRVYLLLVVAVLAVVLSAVVWAAQENEPMAPPGEAEQMGMMGRMGPAAIAGWGNHIYVVAGGMILKYDADLNLVKKAELPASERPTMGGRMGRGGGGRGGGGGMRGGGMRRRGR